MILDKKQKLIQSLILPGQNLKNKQQKGLEGQLLSYQFFTPGANPINIFTP